MTFEIEGFTPLGVIGQGGFGTVHRAADDAHGREVAIKILGRINDDSARRRFDRERRAMGTLSGHPTIGIVYTSGFTAKSEPYIVMEMIRGGSLADRLEKDGPLPTSEVVELGATLAEALHHAHEGGVLHLDLKPENILMSRFGQPKIVDFGIAAIVDDESATSTIRATPSYADPQVLDGKPGTEQSDVYGLAATLFTLLAGSPPYSGEPSGLYRVMRRVALDPVPRVDRDDVSAQLADLLQRAMAKDPQERPESMDEFAHLLGEVDAESVTRRRAPHRRVDRSSSGTRPTPESLRTGQPQPEQPQPEQPQPEQPQPVQPQPVQPSTPRLGENVRPFDDWPGEGGRPRLPGAVDSSNPMERPESVLPRLASVVPAQPAPPSPPPPSPPPPSSPAPSYSFAPASSSTSGDWPQHSAPLAAPEPSNGRRANMVAVAVLATLAVILAVVLAFVVIRRGDQGRGAEAGIVLEASGFDVEIPA